MLETVRSALVNQGAEYAGGGLFASVYFHEGDKVVKLVRSSDGTRNWLEFCAYHTAMGTATRMMPKVYAVYAVVQNDLSGDGYVGYVAVLERLTEQCAYDGVSQLSGLCRADDEAFTATMQLWRDYWDDVLGMSSTEPEDFFCDLHRGNIMLRDGHQVVLTDPNSEGYIEPRATLDWTLE